MGIDHGDARIGIALSDELRMLARPLEFVPAKSPWARLKAIINEYDVGGIVIGLPLNMNGSEGPAADKVRAFIKELEKHVHVPIYEEDERLTTVQADYALAKAGIKARNRKTKIDASAAAVILQDYLDRDGI